MPEPRLGSEEAVSARRRIEATLALGEGLVDSSSVGVAGPSGKVSKPWEGEYEHNANATESSIRNK